MGVFYFKSADGTGLAIHLSLASTRSGSGWPRGLARQITRQTSLRPSSPDATQVVVSLPVLAHIVRFGPDGT